MNKAIFLDKDGTLIPDIPYNAEPELVQLQPDSVEGLYRFHQKGFLLVVVSNQSGSARGYFTSDKLSGIENRLKDLLAEFDIPLSGFYYCPHNPDGVNDYATDCTCRKPKPGMFYTAAAELNIDLSFSWMIGDILNDVEAGNRAGCKTVLINNGNETEWLSGDYRSPSLTCQSINQAADEILITKNNE
jgi:D-glycero-D-manno-heptose 1,7-bisphosphate phosphatase